MPRDMSMQTFQAVIERQSQSETMELVRILDEADFWSEDFAENAVLNAKKEWVRRAGRSFRGHQDEPLFPNVRTITADGETKRAYKSVMMFEPEDCSSLTDYHRKQAEHHMHMANWYARMRERLTGDQLDLPFPDRDI